MRARLDIASERGGVLVMVAILLPTLILFTTFAVETGNWWVQKRHLQVQADAAALAAAGDFQIPCSDAPIASRVSEYVGRNQWIPTAARTFTRLNSPTFYNQPGRPSPSESELHGTPCADKAIDVKMTETDVPWFFRAANVDFINARARVSFRTITANQDVLPVGVPATEPKRVRVTFVDESSGATLGTRDLVRRTDAVNGLRIWDNAVDNGGSPLGLDVTQSHIGVRVAVSGSSSTVACADAYVQCYDLGSANGLAHIRGWSDQPAVGSTAAPQARSVFLNTPGGSTGCSDAYFSSGSACTIGVSAKVDFSSGAASATQSDRQVTATVNGTAHALVYNTTTGRYEYSGFAIPAAAGPKDVKLDWVQQKGSVGSNACTTQPTGNGNNKNPCFGTFGNVQRTFGASDARSGPVALVQVGDAGSTSGVDDVQRCSTTFTGCHHDFVVRVGIKNSLALAKAGDPPTVLRVGPGSGSQNQSLDCDPNVSKLADELAFGCGPQYVLNPGTTCPGPVPLSCVPIETGQKTNQVPMGLNHRILGDEKATSCTSPNRWPNYAADDKRILSVFVVPFGAFQNNGGGQVPIQDFAYFYVTGWTGSGQGFANPCEGNGDDPVPNNDPAYIVGHFIKYVQTLNKSGGGTQTCDFDSTSGCVAVLDR